MPTANPIFIKYKEQFASLWQLPPPAAPRVVLDWDDTPGLKVGPGGRIELGGYLTAFDWALAMALKYPHYEWRLYILDRLSDKYPGSHAARLFRHAPELLPWMRFYRPEETARLEQDIGTPFAVTREIDTDLLRSIWVAGLSQPDGRHAIANLIGPHLLLRGMGMAPPSEPLDWLLQAMGFLDPDSPGYEPPPWCERVEGVDRFVLLDDMAHLGWADFLRYALGSSADVTPMSDPSAALAPLERALRNGAPVGLSGTAREVLFLDLRLFAGDPAGERNFFRDLLSLAGLVSDEFEPAELDAVRMYIEGDRRETREYHLALTLLPRLLAAADPKLPIVLFSSTGRKEIVDRLVRHRNIVLDFEKPRFAAGECTATVVETRLRLRRAIERVRRMTRAREVCLEIVAGNAVAPAAQAGEAVELYLDESGDPGHPGLFAIGGILLTYPHVSKIGDLNQELWNRGLVWGYAEDHPDNLPKRKLEKRLAHRDYEQYLAALQALLWELGIGIRAFALVRRSKEGATPGVLDGETESIYRNDLSAVLEAALFEVLAGMTLLPNEIRVHLATRVFEVLGPDQQDDLRRRFGIGKLKDETRFRCFSLSANEAYPLVNGVRHRRQGVPRSVTWARGAILEAGYRDSPARPFQVHYLADWVVHLALMHVNGAFLPPTASRWFSDGFLESDRRIFMDWLLAGRSLDNSDVVGGLLAASRALRPAYDFQRWVRPRLASAANRLPADAFDAFCGKF